MHQLFIVCGKLCFMMLDSEVNCCVFFVELAYAVEDLGVDGELTENDDDPVIQRDDSGLTFTKHNGIAQNPLFF